MVWLFECGNFHSKPEKPFIQWLDLPSPLLLSVNQAAARVYVLNLTIFSLGKPQASVPLAISHFFALLPPEAYSTVNASLRYQLEAAALS